MSAGLCHLSIREAGARMRAGTLSPVALTEAFLARIAALDPGLNAFIRVTGERARADAARAGEELAAGRDRGPLHGIPVALKDIFATAGIPTTAHSRLLLDNVPEEDSACARRLAEAGAVLLGKLGTHEFAIGGPSDDLPFARPLNPWDRAAFTGGSSSGSGVAIAAGLAMAALGTDAGGSIRIPATFCGITGLKPSRGRVSGAGVIPLAPSTDHCGPMTWRAEDAALVLAAIAGHDPADPATEDRPVPDYATALAGDLAGLKIGAVRHFYEDDRRAEPEQRAAMDAALEVMAGLGAEIEDVRLPPLDDYYACCLIIVVAEGFALHRRDLAERAGEYGEMCRSRLSMGAFIDEGAVAAARRVRPMLTAAIEAALDRVDVLVTAGGPGPAPPVAGMPKHGLFMNPYLGAPFNVSGHPAAAVRCGFSENGLPLGMQIAGRLFDEATVLRVAHAYERATPWADRRPELDE